MKNYLKAILERAYHLVMGKRKMEKFFTLIEKSPVLEKLFKETENQGYLVIVSRFFTPVSADAVVATEKVEKPGMAKQVWLNYKTIDRALSKDPDKQLTAIGTISHEVGHILNRGVALQIDAQRKFFCSRCSRKDCLYEELLADETGLNFIQKELKDGKLGDTVDMGVSSSRYSLFQCSGCIPLVFSNSPPCPFAPEIKAMSPMEDPEYKFLISAILS